MTLEIGSLLLGTLVGTGLAGICYLLVLMHPHGTRCPWCGRWHRL